MSHRFEYPLLLDSFVPDFPEQFHVLWQYKGERYKPQLFLTHSRLQTREVPPQTIFTTYLKRTGEMIELCVVCVWMCGVRVNAATYYTV